MRIIVLVAFVLLGSICPSLASRTVKPFVIDDDPGGSVNTYMDFYRRLEATGIQIVLNGRCVSACTIVLHVHPQQVCATPKAILGFHNAVDPDTDKVDLVATKEYARHFYPPSVAAWFLKQHFDKRNRPIWRKATDLGVAPCSKAIMN